LDFDGRYGLVRNQNRGRWTSLTCLGGGHLSDGAHHAEYDGGNISMVFDDITVVGDVSGAGGTIRFSRPPWARTGWMLWVDSQRTDYGVSGSIVSAQIPKGRHAIWFLPAGHPLQP
jgi:hypothetical protein